MFFLTCRDAATAEHRVAGLEARLADAQAELGEARQRCEGLQVRASIQHQISQIDGTTSMLLCFAPYRRPTPYSSHVASCRLRFLGTNLVIDQRMRVYDCRRR